MKICALFFALLAAASGGASASCPPTDQDAEWSASCFEGTAAARQVKREHRANIVANKAGYATIMIEQPRELVAVDRRGVIVVPDIRYTGDYDYPDGRGGLARFRLTTKNRQGASVAKCGYFNVHTFQIAIPAVYDHCLSFGEQTASVCNDCAVHCTELECQDSILVGGQGFTIDSRNRIVRRFKQPSLEQVLARPR